MADKKTDEQIHVRHVHTGEMKTVTAEQRETQDKNYWVKVTDVTPPTSPAAQRATPKAHTATE